MKYPSAMNRGGSNIVLFDPSICRVSESVIKVTALDISFTEEIWKLTDDYPDL
jgi:hypothetical protein